MPHPILRERQNDLESYEFQMGAARGRLALTMDLLTDALVLVGQHGVYCQSARQAGKPAMDVQIITQLIEGAKELTIEAMSEIKRERQARNAD
jgi:hypothetical protein